MEQLEDSRALTLDFGFEQVLTSPTVNATFDMYGQVTGGSTRSNELFMAQVNLQEEIDKNFKTNLQYCT
jgi:hypothetical protein